MEVLLPLTLKGRVDDSRIRSFIEFLKSSKDPAYEKINSDQWISFLDFALEYDDVSTYDADGSAWPTLIDDYVAFCVNHGYT